jgi:hypothetical protein
MTHELWHDEARAAEARTVTPADVRADFGAAFVALPIALVLVSIASLAIIFGVGHIILSGACVR